jgi:hypothetical protein
MLYSSTRDRGTIQGVRKFNMLLTNTLCSKQSVLRNQLGFNPSVSLKTSISLAGGHTLPNALRHIGKPRITCAGQMVKLIFIEQCKSYSNV